MMSSAVAKCAMSRAMLSDRHLKSHFFRFLESVNLQNSIRDPSVTHFASDNACFTSSSSLMNSSSSLEKIIEENYPLLNSPKILKSLVDYALQKRDENLQKKNEQELDENERNELLGSWGVIIDIFKDITLKKREKASQMMQKLCQLGYQVGPEGITCHISELRRDRAIDSVFVDLVSSSYEDCQKMNGGKDILQILKFIDTSLQPEKEFYSQLIAQLEGVPSPPSAPPSVSMAPPSSYDRHDEPIEGFDQSELVASGELLQQTITSCQGDAKKLKTAILLNLRAATPPPLLMSSGCFLKVLRDNIAACQQASYLNKAKLLQFIEKIIQDEISKKPSSSDSAAVASEGGGAISEEEDITGAKYGLNVYHAPQFVEDNNNEAYLDIEVSLSLLLLLSLISSSGKVSLVDETDGYVDALKVSDALVYTATGSSAKTKKVNKKKKNIKSGPLPRPFFPLHHSQLFPSVHSSSGLTDALKKVHSLVGLLGNHLETYGWAVCDHTIPEDIVRRVRIEASLFTTFYEQSEIWVGKQADIGAHVAVPSVRGDKVLWMCGGHLHRASPEGLTRTVKTHGEIEPCRLEVKAKAPIRRFAAMKELIISIDKLVFELKEKCPTLSGLYERSDAMLTIYPGEGSRFAKHIDNTTQDGRKITVLCYLNPDWEESMGGALRLFIPKKFRQKEAAAAAAEEKESKATRETTVGGEASSSAHNSKDDYHMKAVDVFPQGGRVAIFYSSDIPHEVLPTFGNRHALTIWYYDTNERKQTLERAKESGKGARASKASVETQQAAQQFVSRLMSPQSPAAAGTSAATRPADEAEGQEENEMKELKELQDLVKELSDDVIEIVANITGAPSLESFRDGFEMLTIQDLKQMRGLFQRMGLGSYHVVKSVA